MFRFSEMAANLVDDWRYPNGHYTVAAINTLKKGSLCDDILEQVTEGRITREYALDWLEEEALLIMNDHEKALIEAARDYLLTL
jgi:hypothetical protein